MHGPGRIIPVMQGSRQAQWIGVLALLACAALWSLNGPLIKILQRPDGDSPGVAGLTIACYRSLIGGFFFLIPAWPRLTALRRVSPRWIIGSVVTFTLMTASFVIATTQTAASSAIALQYLSPVVVFLLSPLLLGERARLSEGFALVGALAGLAVIFFGHPPGAAGPLVIAVCSGLGYGALTVVLRGLRGVEPIVVVALNFVGSGLLMGAAMLVLPDSQFVVTGKQVAILALMSVVQFAAPYVLFSWALQRVEAHKASLIVLLEAILNPLFTFIAVGEAVPTPTLIGGPLILASVAAWMIVSWRNARGTPDVVPAA